MRRKVIAGEWFLALTGAYAIAPGRSLVMRPAAAVLGFVLAALHAVVRGHILIALGLRVRTWAKRHATENAGVSVR